MKLINLALFGSAIAGLPLAAASAVLEEVVVVAHPLSAEGLAQASEVLEGDELARKATINLGSTLANEPGIHGAPFGSGVGRPVIHGLAGPRVKIMEDRIDTLDVSVTSADHATTVDPFIAERVEVLKGASTLLYGSGAIGGVVDVHTGRIPHDKVDGLTGAIETRYDNNTKGDFTAGKFKFGLGDFVFHFDGSRKNGDDYEIPGFAESKGLRALEEEEHHDEDEDHDEEEHHEEEEEAFGELPGSFFQSDSGAGGVSYIADWGFVGIGTSFIDSKYGLPGGHEHAHEDEDEEDHEDEEEHEHEGEEEGTPILEMFQRRTDFEMGLVDPFGSVKSINLRFGHNDYNHVEIEGDGAIATRFDNEAWEMRGEMVYEGGEWLGAAGFQYSDREFSTFGEEAFVPPVDTTDFGIFWIGEKSFDSFDLEVGGRIGRVDHQASAGPDRDFTTYALSGGIVMPLDDQNRFGLSVDYSSRAPTIEELYSDGPHLVTNAFEVGNSDLDEEMALNIGATYKHQSENWDVQATVYITQFSDFIYEIGTGEEEDELPVFEFRQDDATFYGVDLEVTKELAKWDYGSLRVRGLADFVKAAVDVSGDDDLPRIPPFRYGVGFELNKGIFSLFVDYRRVTKQDDFGPNELGSEAYNDLEAHLVARPTGDRVNFEIFLTGKNLTDDEQRHHSSFIKDFAPAPGRSIEAGVRIKF